MAFACSQWRRAATVGCVLFAAGRAAAQCTGCFSGTSGACQAADTVCYALNYPGTDDEACPTGTTLCSTATSCPSDSTGTNVGSGCSCDAGFDGTITATDSSPFFSGTCSAVSCPSDSTGTNVPAGDCSCDAGFDGTITATDSSPFFSGSCSAGVLHYHPHCLCLRHHHHCLDLRHHPHCLDLWQVPGSPATSAGVVEVQVGAPRRRTARSRDS